MDLINLTDHMGGQLGPLIKLDDGEGIGCQEFELIPGAPDDGVGDHCSGSLEFVIYDLSFTTTVRTEWSWRVEVSATGFAVCTDQIVSVLLLSPETCNTHA